MRNITRRISLLAAPLVFVACNPFAAGPRVCHDGIFYAVSVQIRDSISGDAVAGASGVIRKGEYEEITEEYQYVENGGLTIVHLAHGDTPGLCDVEFSHPDFETWRRTVRVPADACSPVGTADLEFVHLQPLGGYGSGPHHHHERGRP